MPAVLMATWSGECNAGKTKRGLRGKRTNMSADDWTLCESGGERDEPLITDAIAKEPQIAQVRKHAL